MSFKYLPDLILFIYAKRKMPSEGDLINNLEPEHYRRLWNLEEFAKVPEDEIKESCGITTGSGMTKVAEPVRETEV